MAVDQPSVLSISDQPSSAPNRGAARGAFATGRGRDNVQRPCGAGAARCCRRSAAVHAKRLLLCKLGPVGPLNRETDGMSEGMSRRKALSLLGLGAALGFTLPAVLAPSEVEAQEAAAPAEATGTHGMNRRQSRRHGRHERRHGRHERRHERRTGEKPEATAPAATPPPQ